MHREVVEVTVPLPEASAQNAPSPLRLHSVRKTPSPPGYFRVTAQHSESLALPQNFGFRSLLLPQVNIRWGLAHHRSRFNCNLLFFEIMHQSVRNAQQSPEY